MSEGRKTHKDLGKNRDQKLSNQLGKIKNIMEKDVSLSCPAMLFWLIIYLYPSACIVCCFSLFCDKGVPFTFSPNVAVSATQRQCQSYAKVDIHYIYVKGMTEQCLLQGGDYSKAFSSAQSAPDETPNASSAAEYDDVRHKSCKQP